MDALVEYVQHSALKLGVTFPSFSQSFILLAAVISIYLTKMYYAGGVCTSRTLLHGKTVIVTGSNVGVGLETAVDLAKRGARVILACRSTDRGTAAVNEVKRRSGNQAVVFAELDLASLQSVRDFSAKILKEEGQIDILINNAAVFLPPYTMTRDGFELQFGVNYLGHFLLTNLLLDRLKEAPSARIVHLCSLAHDWGSRKINFEDLQSECSYWRWPSYCQSKLAVAMFTTSLAKRLKGSNVTTYAVHPGGVRSNLFRHLPAIVRMILWPGMWVFVKSTWQGAQTSIYCAVTEGLENVSGKYFADCKAMEFSNPLATDEAVCERLWQVSAQLVGLDRN